MTNDIIPINNNQPIIPKQADTDEQVIALWLHGRSRATQRVYLSDIDNFLGFVNKRLSKVILRDLQAYSDYLVERELMPATRHRMLSAVKSLFGFAHKIGYLPYDVGRALRLPKFKDTISERILSESELQKMIGLEPKLRNQLILRVLYATALRISEFCQLRWDSLIKRETVLLDGSASYDKNLDELTYSWNFVSKPEDSLAVIANPGSVQASFVADWPGTYIVSLVVNDGIEDSDTDNVTIEVMVTQDDVVLILFNLIDIIKSLDESSLKNSNMKKGLVNKINAVLNKIDRGLYEEALDKLQNDILQKTNGCAANSQPDKNDWIKTCPEQGQIYPLVIQAIDFLGYLI